MTSSSIEFGRLFALENEIFNPWRVNPSGGKYSISYAFYQSAGDLVRRQII
jgi:hypothetical protein